MYDPYADFTSHILSNGLQVNSIFWDRPWVRVEIVVHSGGREDPRELPGLAHFVEHTVSKNIPGVEYDGAKEFFELCGGRANFGCTDYYSTTYSFTVPADLISLRKALSLFGSMLLKARIEKHVDRERQIILREFNERYPFLEKLEWDMDINRSLFKGHRLESWNRPLGRTEGFLSVTKEELQSFYDTHYVPANMSIVVVGGITVQQILSELSQSFFGIKKAGTRNPIPSPFVPLPTPTKQTHTVKMSDHVNFKVDRTEYKSTWAFPADFPEQSLRVFGLVLDKVLFDEIREKRELAYAIDFNHENFHDVHKCWIHGLVSPKSTRDIGELIRECIERASLDSDLFERKLRLCTQKCFMVDLSGATLANDAADELATYHRIIPMQKEWNDLQKVTFEHMAEAAAYLSSKQQYTFIARP